MDFETAKEIAESADLPDGAYFAMIGDLMGIDYESVMDLFEEEDLGIMMITVAPPTSKLIELRADHRRLDNLWRLSAASTGPSCLKCDQLGDQMAAIETLELAEVARLKNELAALIEQDGWTLDMVAEVMK